MALKHVLVELRQTRPLREAISISLFAALPAEVAEARPDIPGIILDETFPLVPIPREAPSAAQPEAFASLAFNERAPEQQTVLVRGVMDTDATSMAFEAAEAHPDVVAIYSDPVIETCPTCISTAAVGTDKDVAALLSVSQLAASGMDGSGVLLAIVDTGINLAHLQSHGLHPNFDAVRSFVAPPLPGRLLFEPGQAPVAHGTMCAFDALIAAPRATLLDIAVLPLQGIPLDQLLSRAILGYSFLLSKFSGARRPGDFQSLVVSNSWGMFNRSSDFPPGTPGNYSDDPTHPFSRIVGTLERAGADILFAAGNCGHECPDMRCGDEVDAGIYGANSHPQVLSVAGVDIKKNRVGYSTRGPGHLEKQKPDISGFTHFKGSGVFPVDGGTSAATPVVAGVVAAFRSRFPSSPSATPAMIRNVVTRVAEDRGAVGFDFEYGWGVVDGSRLASLQSLSAEAGPEPSGGRPGTSARCPDCAPGQPKSQYQPKQGDTMVQEEQFMRALAAFEETPADVTAAGVDVCGIYAKAKPILQGILPFIRLIPRIGKPAAKAIEALMAALDSFCGAPTAATFATSQPVGAPDEQAFMQALAAFEQPGVDVTTAGVDICGTYKKVKPILQGILPFISLIPGIGKPAAAAITALMAALDAICH